MSTRLPEQVRNPARLAALRRSGLLDSPAEEAFDRLTRIATAALRLPVALVSLVDADRQFFKSQVGLPEPWGGARQTPLSHSFCQHVVGTGEPLVVDDARTHPLVRENAGIRDLGVSGAVGDELARIGHGPGARDGPAHAAALHAPGEQVGVGAFLGAGHGRGASSRAQRALRAVAGGGAAPACRLSTPFTQLPHARTSSPAR